MKIALYSNEKDKKEFEKVADAARHFDIYPSKIYYALRSNKNEIIRDKDEKVFYLEKYVNPNNHIYLINDQKFKRLKDAQECLGVPEMTLRYAIKNNHEFVFNRKRKKYLLFPI